MKSDEPPPPPKNESASASIGCGVIAFAVVAGLAAWGVYGIGSRTRNVEQLMAPVIAAAERFHEKTGDYPWSPDELVPDYITEVPMCPGDRRPLYMHKQPNDTKFPGPAVGDKGFVLTCYTFMFTKHTYDSERRSWVSWD